MLGSWTHVDILSHFKTETRSLIEHNKMMSMIEIIFDCSPFNWGNKREERRVLAAVHEWIQPKECGSSERLKAEWKKVNLGSGIMGRIKWEINASFLFGCDIMYKKTFVVKLLVRPWRILATLSHQEDYILFLLFFKTWARRIYFKIVIIFLVSFNWGLRVG